MPLSVIVAEVAAQTGVSVLGLPPLKSDTLYSVEWRAIPARTAFESIGTYVAHSASFADGMVTYTATPVPEALVLQTGLVDPDEIRKAVEQLGDGGKSSVVGDRLVVTGPPGIVDAAEDVARRLEQGVDGWQVVVRYVVVSEGLRREAGVDVAVAGRADASIGGSVGASSVEDGVSLGGRLTASLIATALERQRGARLLREGTLFVLEGRDARFSSGQVVPVPRRTVSDQGTVTVTGYDNVETGFILAVAARRASDGVLLDLKPEVSTIIGYVEGAPIRSRSQVESTLVVPDGGSVVLTGFESSDVSDERRGVPGFLGYGIFEQATDSLAVVVEARRVYARR